MEKDGLFCFADANHIQSPGAGHSHLCFSSRFFIFVLAPEVMDLKKKKKICALCLSRTLHRNLMNPIMIQVLWLQLVKGWSLFLNQGQLLRKRVNLFLSAHSFQVAFGKLEGLPTPKGRCLRIAIAVMKHSMIQSSLERNWFI